LFSIGIHGAEVAGGTFKAKTIDMRGEWQYSRIMLDDDTDIDAIHVTQSMFLSSGGQPAYIGYSNTNQNLPAGINLLFGIDNTNRASLSIGVSPISFVANGTGRLAATGGGVLTAWLTDLRVGGSTAAANSPWQGVLDTAAMDTCVIDAQNIYVGTERPDSQPADTPRGTGFIEFQIPELGKYEITSLIGMKGFFM